MEDASESEMELAEVDEERGDRSVMHTNLCAYADKSMETTGTAFPEPQDEQENFLTEMHLDAASLR